MYKLKEFLIENWFTIALFGGIILYIWVTATFFTEKVDNSNPPTLDRQQEYQDYPGCVGPPGC